VEVNKMKLKNMLYVTIMIKWGIRLC